MVVTVLCVDVHAHQADTDYQLPCTATRKKRYLLQSFPVSTYPCAPSYFVPPATRSEYCSAAKELLYDAALLHRNLLTWDSVKIISSLFPFFVASRMLDDQVHHYFYDARHHKNIHQLPHWCHEACKFAIGIPIVLLGTQAFLSVHEEMRQTSRMLLLGIPFVIWGKTVIKKATFDCSLRPWNEKFSAERRAYGGFPSGHVAEATYTAVLYGMRYGPRYAIPLGLGSLIVALTFVNCNRHLVSQVVAGAGLGALYGVAANRRVDQKLAQAWALRMSTTDTGDPALQLSWSF